ncbi:lytic polysaccharide monooxygenase [Pilimelia columellifera]|uniref:Chitin-binding type-4 domain-containing protein n=1 Tax=Pilimelia columellifera subsp. columellifera TaxID=706583 RepID=A0ABN3NLV4_9ACTN
MGTWRLGAAVAAMVLVGVVPATAAFGHGAVQRPASRGYACGPEGGDAARLAACRAARDAGEIADWDNLRIADVAGRDRELIPDGRLCSAGIGRYRGLDLARDDWPATQLRPASDLRVRYRTTIPHQGTFRLYLTNDGYDPTRPLRWADLGREPFLTAVDPPLANGAYTFAGRMPQRTGRHLIYTIWQNSSTPDTYYSCSDVVFAATPRPGATGDDVAVPAASAGERAPVGPPAPTPQVATRPAASVGEGGMSGVVVAVLGVASAVAGAVFVGLRGFAGRRRRR